MSKISRSSHSKVTTCVLVVCMVLVSLFVVACGSGGVETTEPIDSTEPIEATGGSNDGSSNDAPSANATSWPAQEALASLDAADIKQIRVFTATEDGVTDSWITLPENIKEISRLLCEVKMGEATNMDTLDDDLSIDVETDTGSLEFDFVGDIVILDNGERYEVEGLDALKDYLYEILG